MLCVQHILYLIILDWGCALIGPASFSRGRICTFSCVHLLWGVKTQKFHTGLKIQGCLHLFCSSTCKISHQWSLARLSDTFILIGLSENLISVTQTSAPQPVLTEVPERCWWDHICWWRVCVCVTALSNGRTHVSVALNDLTTSQYHHYFTCNLASHTVKIESVSIPVLSHNQSLSFTSQEAWLMMINDDK